MATYFSFRPYRNVPSNRVVFSGALTYTMPVPWANAKRPVPPSWDLSSSSAIGWPGVPVQ